MALNLNLPLPSSLLKIPLSAAQMKVRTGRWPPVGCPPMISARGTQELGKQGRPGKLQSPQVGPWTEGPWACPSQNRRGTHCPKGLTSSSYQLT